MLLIAAPGTMSKKVRSAPLVMGSLSEKAQRKGRSNFRERRPGVAVRGARRVVWGGRARAKETGERPLCTLVRERSIVGGDDLGWQVGRRPEADDSADGHRRAPLVRTAASPRTPRRAGTSPVGSPVFAATTRRNRSGSGGNEPEADEAAPVLANERDVVEPEPGPKEPTSSTRHGARRCSRSCLPACPNVRIRSGQEPRRETRPRREPGSSFCRGSTKKVRHA